MHANTTHAHSNNKGQMATNDTKVHCSVLTLPADLVPAALRMSICDIHVRHAFVLRDTGFLNAICLEVTPMRSIHLRMSM